MVTKNFESLARTPLRKQALLIGEAVYGAINTKAVIDRTVKYNEKTELLKVASRSFDLKKYKRVLCIGFGKVALEAVTELQAKLQQKIVCGFVIDLKEGSLGNIVCRVGTHPYPSMVNVEATKELLEMLSGSTKDDLILFVVSGGGSSLLCSPHEMSCEVQVSIIASLTAVGSPIRDINTVRKHISNVKGGQLAKLCYPATVVSLIFSDVPGDDMSLVASGPTVLDSTTVQDAKEILNRYNVLDKCGLASCSLLETPKDKKYFENVYNVIVVSSKEAVSAAKTKAEDLGWKVSVYSDCYEGNAHEVGKKVVKLVQKGQCLIGAGETTVIIKGHGLEGRSQAMALAALPYLEEEQVLLTLASDGQDHSDAAGALVDANSLRVAQKLGLDGQVYLDNNDSYHYLESTGDLVFTGITGSNISDFFICLRN
jgi:glycerate-2-kinase